MLTAMLRGQAKRKIDVLWNAVWASLTRFTAVDCANYSKAAEYDPDLTKFALGPIDIQDSNRF